MSKRKFPHTVCFCFGCEIAYPEHNHKYCPNCGYKTTMRACNFNAMYPKCYRED